MTQTPSSQEGAPMDFHSGTAESSKVAYIRQLHARAPVHRDPAGYWVISRFDDVRAVLLDHQRFSSAVMGAEFPLLSDDPPRHTQLRALVNKAFTPARIAAMTADVRTLAESMVRKIPSGEEIDVVDAITSPLPVAVIGRMLGVPERDQSRFKRWSDAIVGLMDDPFGGERIKTLSELSEYFLNLVAERRRHPAEDLITAVAHAEEAGTRLDDRGVVGFINLLLIAGNETTTNLLSNLLHLLSRTPELWARLRAETASSREAMLESAIEEALRTESPAQYVARRVRERVELSGEVLNPGDTVIVYLAAANRDQDKWADPDNFEMARERERHLAFGHGVHFCLGAPLARLEAHAVMSALVEQFARIEPGEIPAQRIPHGLLFGFSRLPLRLYR